MNFLIKDEFHCKQQLFITKYSFSNQENYRSKYHFDLCEVVSCAELPNTPLISHM